MIGGEGRRQQPGRQVTIRGAGQWAKPKGSLNLQRMLPASLITFGVIAEVHRIEAQLFSNEAAELDWGSFTLSQNPPWEAQVAEHERKAKTIRIAAAAIDQSQVLGIWRVAAHHVALIARGSFAVEPLRRGEQFLVWHVCPC